MNKPKTPKIVSLGAIGIITIIFLAVISPLKGLSIFTFPMILFGIGLWVSGIMMLIKSIINRKSEKHQLSTLIVTILFLISFIPIGFTYMKISGQVRTKITIDVRNQSDSELLNVLIYGTGTIFEGTDTLKVSHLDQGQELRYITRAGTKAHSSGNVVMEFDIYGEHLVKNIAGEFSINPYSIKQHWTVVVNQQFLNEK